MRFQGLQLCSVVMLGDVMGVPDAAFPITGCPDI
jgi:hypothetical protein